MKEELRYLAQRLWTEADNWWHEADVDHLMLSEFKGKIQEAIDLLGSKVSR